MDDLLHRLGVVTLPYEVPLLVDIAREAERGGLARVGMADSPILYGEIYPSITAVLSATSRIQVGPNVTNPVSRHWTVHAASARTIDAMYPGRFYLGLAAGDGARSRAYGDPREAGRGRRRGGQPPLISGPDCQAYPRGR